MMTSSQPPVQDWISALRASHERFRSLVADLDANALQSPSYDTEWTLAPVVSHIGSGAEIFTLFLEAALAGTDAPTIETMHPIWDTWNARSSVEQRDEALAADEALVARFEATTDSEREKTRMSLFGMDLDLSAIARLRLAEAAVHTWDIAVAADPGATVAADSVALLVAGLGQTAALSGKPGPEPFTVLMVTADPDGAYLISAGEAVHIEATTASATADGTVALPAEAYLRLVYGRLDPEHTPAVSESGARGLADLRQVFRGM
jgi:uncharacterized protein (TIGR03083 family)